MATTTKSQKVTTLYVSSVDGEARERTLARALLDPSVTAGDTLNRLNGNHDESDINAFVAELRAQAEAASAGNLGRSEAMLTGQAATLDALFHVLTRWALNHTREGGN